MLAGLHPGVKLWVKEVIMDIPALGRDSVIFESFSFISLDSIMDSIDSSQIPVLIGRSQRRRPEGAEEHPPRRLFPGWGSRGRAFNSGLAGQMARTRDADADQCAVCRKPALLSATSPKPSGSPGVRRQGCDRATHERQV